MDPGWNKLPLTDKSVVVGCYLPSPAPRLPITTVQPIHPRPKHSNPSFPLTFLVYNLQYLHNSLLHLLLTPRRPSLNLHQSDVVGTPSDAGRWPLLSHMRLLQELPASSYLSLLPAATALDPDPTQPLCASCTLLYRIQNTKLENTNRKTHTNTNTRAPS